MMYNSKTIKTIIIILIGTLMLSCATQKSRENSTASITLDTVRVQGRVGVKVNFSNLPDQNFVLEIPEIFMVQKIKSGLANYSNQQWNFSKEGGKMELIDGNYKYVIVLSKHIKNNITGLKWKIDVTNNSKESLYELAAFNCWTMNTAPLFKDIKMERTFVTDSNGNQKVLKDVQKTQGGGRRHMQFYPSINGIDLNKSAWLSSWMVIGPESLTGKTISQISTDGNYLFENKVDGEVAFFFNNWEEDHGCIHAAPLLSRELKSGQTASASGIFQFTNRN